MSDVADRPGVVVDTSVALPALDRRHTAHATCFELVRAERPGIAGHAWFETYARLTSAPGRRIAPADAHRAITTMFPFWAPLPTEDVWAVAERMVAAGVTGGAVYDALIAAAAARQQVPLISADLRAAATYAAVGAQVRFLDLR